MRMREVVAPSYYRGDPIWLALRNIPADWRKAAHHGKEAMSQFAILHDHRFDAAG